jgi:hypothetical protein
MKQHPQMEKPMTMSSGVLDEKFGDPHARCRKNRPADRHRHALEPNASLEQRKLT